MKKQLSLIMSLVLIVSMIFSVSVHATASIIINPVTVCLDMAGAQSASTSYLNGSSKIMLNGQDSGAAVSSSAPALQSILASHSGYTNVLSVTKSSSKTPYFIIYPKKADGSSIDEGIMKFTAKIYLTEALDSSKRYFRSIHTGGSSSDNSRQICEGSEWLPGVWYNTEWTINLEETTNNAKLVFTPELSAQSSAEVENYTISHTYNYAREDIQYLRIDMLPSTTSGTIYYADLKIRHYPTDSYTKADFVSVGNDGEIAYGQDQLSFTLSEEIPGLGKEYILINDAEGNNVDIASIEITSDGTNPVVNLTAGQTFESGTDYTLTILADAWGSESTQDSGSGDEAVTDIYTYFYTPEAPVFIKPPLANIDMVNAETADVPYIEDGYFLTVDDVPAMKLTGTASRSVETLENGSKALKMTRTAKDGDYIYFTYTPKDEQDEALNPTSGKYIVTAKFMSESTLGASRRCLRAIWTGGSSAGVSILLYEDGDPFLTNVWYDLCWTIDLDNDKITLVLTPELSNATEAQIEEKTITKTVAYTKDDLTYIRGDFQQTDTSKNIYFADIQAMYYSGESYTKGKITSVGTDGEVDYGQNEISFETNLEIPELEMKHISVTNSEGRDIEITSAAIESNGEGQSVKLTTKNVLPSWSQYTITISGDAWGNCALQNSGGPDEYVTDIYADFVTPAAPFDMKDPVFTLSGGNLRADTTVINTSGNPENITLLLAVYDETGRIKSVTPKSFNNFEAAYPGEEKYIEAPISEGDTARLMAINGWDIKLALFGKYWDTSYSELN